MHIPGQGFGHVQIKADRDSRTRFTDLQCQNFKGWISWSQKGTTENYIVILPFPWDIVCILSLFALHGAFLFVILAVMVTRCFVKVAGTFVVSVCWPSSSTFVSHGLESQVEQSNTQHCMRPFAYGQTQPTSCTLFFKYYAVIMVGKKFN